MMKLGLGNLFNKKTVKQYGVNFKNELDEVARLYTDSSLESLTQIAQKRKHDVNIYQKGQDLLLVNVGQRTVPLRLSEVVKEYKPTGREVNPDDFSPIVLSKIYPHI